jgi:hypothetical protein
VIPVKLAIMLVVTLKENLKTLNQMLLDDLHDSSFP